ncbi:tyrosine-protein phosphatase [Bdellovibrio sp. BCCA]|uniref:tyrosine-protein phosphatase n=1 Tax=Bdellovibrio sp. BCCA TaxID=3136281 RepID=UPI0030F2F879
MKLEGGINFRDLGGYLTADGRRVKKGHFFRSGSLSRLTMKDCEVLQTLPVKHIIDYRDHHESENDKDQLWQGVHYECCPANPASHASSADDGDFFTSQRLEALPKDFMETLYQRLPFANPAYQKLFQRVENLQNGSLVQHCAVGKDRTGVGSALLLLSLGVPKQTVVEDYLLTEQTLHPFRIKILNQIEHSLSTEALKRFHYMMSANEQFLHAAFGEIEKRYGSMESYFANEFSLSSEKRQSLQTKFLE